MQKRPLKLAHVQHPMILLVHEDRGEPVVGERVAPWGAPDLTVYAERVRRNLAALRQYPELRLNYEFSGVEMEMLAEVAPDTIAAMRDMAAQGRLAFVGGDYSQPHGHLYSGELNYRQLDYGLRVFSELVNYRVTCAFHQETCAHDQMPQLLRAFGFQSAVPPEFPHTLVPISSPGPCLITDCCLGKGYFPIAKDSVAQWCGLDGSTIPLVIPGRFNSDEYHKGLYRAGHLGIHAPDMDDIADEYYQQVRAAGEFVLLDAQALEEIAHFPPHWQARLTTYWSYSEGQWAEAVYRKIRETEVQLVAEETMAALYAAPCRREFDGEWRTVLAAMHHDVHWMEVTDLKQTYLQRLDAVTARSRDCLAKLLDGRAASSQQDDTLHLINTLPYARREVVTLPAVGDVPLGVVGGDGTPIPCQCVPSLEQPDQFDLYFLADVPACGAMSYSLTSEGLSEGAALPEGADAREAGIQAGETHYTLVEDGTVREAVLRNGTSVLRGPGNDLHFLDAEYQVVGGPGRGGKMVRYHGPVGDIVRVSAPIGDIPTEIEYLASPAMPWLAYTTRFHFHRHQLGVMWEDWTKLNAYWPTRGNAIRHDIPFGAIDGDAELPLYAPSWLSVRGDHGGLVLFNTGTPKHYVEGGTIANVLAWGRETYSNRMHVREWTQQTQYDLSLNGLQRIRSAVQGLSGNDTEVALARHAQRVNTPLQVFGAAQRLALPTPRWSLDLSQTSLLSSALFLRGDRPVCRFFAVGGSTQAIDELRQAIGSAVEVTDLNGRPLDTVTPYRIGYLMLPPLH